MRALLMLLGISVLGCSEAYKILVYSPKFGHSHSNYMGRFADVLQEAGHNVTTLISVLDPAVADGTKLSKIIRVAPCAAVTAMQDDLKKTVADFFTMNNFSPIGGYFMGKFFGKMFATQCASMLEQPGLVEQLKSEQFDVFFTEHFDMCGVGLKHLIAPRALISVAASPAFGPQLAEFGIPAAPSYAPALYMSRLNVHSMWDRIVNLYAEWLIGLCFDPIRTQALAVYRKRFGADFPTLEEISSTSAYVFTNTEPLIDYALPTISKVIPIGGIGAPTPKPLSEEWERVLTARGKTVLFSFGSVAKSAFLPDRLKSSIIETVKALPEVTFIWKYEVDDDFTMHVASKIDNLVLTKWMPQVDILAHPNLAAFITHGGMGSTMETAFRGVPGIFIPIFGDQPRNAGMMEFNRLGKVLDKSDVGDSAKFVATIRAVIDDESYLRNARRVSAMLHRRPFSAQEQLIKYTEFAAEFGASPALRPQSHDMTWIEYHNADIIFVALLAMIVALVITLKLAKRLAARVCCASKTKKE